MFTCALHSSAGWAARIHAAVDGRSRRNCSPSPLCGARRAWRARAARFACADANTTLQSHWDIGLQCCKWSQRNCSHSPLCGARRAWRSREALFACADVNTTLQSLCHPVYRVSVLRMEKTILITFSVGRCLLVQFGLPVSTETQRYTATRVLLPDCTCLLPFGNSVANGEDGSVHLLYCTVHEPNFTC